eukprot:COSAG05_NODE_1067_length_5971_cov_450.254257_5_plen_140_part_00
MAYDTQVELEQHLKLVEIGGVDRHWKLIGDQRTVNVTLFHYKLMCHSRMFAGSLYIHKHGKEGAFDWSMMLVCVMAGVGRRGAPLPEAVVGPARAEQSPRTGAGAPSVLPYLLCHVRAHVSWRFNGNRRIDPNSPDTHI